MNAILPSRSTLRLALGVLTLATLGIASVAPGQTALESRLVTAMRTAQFNGVIDFGPYNESCPGKSFCFMPAKTIAFMPNVDVAIIQLDANGQMVDRANVMLSRDYPTGLVVPLDPNQGAASVRFRKWDIARFDGGTYSSSTGKQLTIKGWTNNPVFTATDDIVAGRTNAPYQFMAPYPASLFKLLIGFKVMRLVDAGTITLDSNYVYSPDKKTTETRSIRNWMDPMITYSDNHSAQAMVKMLHDLNQMTAMNQEFANLGLGTLQVNGTSTTTGGSWNPGQIHVTAFDVARLLWIIDGGTGTFWIGANGQPVTAALLTTASRTYLKGLLADQGFNEVLSTGNLCGAPNSLPGIPALVASRWINPTSGIVVVDGINYGVDVRGCNSSAEVTFAHKTGLTFNYGSDAGIVVSRAGQPAPRHYIIAFVSNLGYRYADPVFANRTSLPCYDPVSPICYTQRIAAMGKAIDDGMK